MKSLNGVIIFFFLHFYLGIKQDHFENGDNNFWKEENKLDSSVNNNSLATPVKIKMDKKDKYPSNYPN